MIKILTKFLVITLTSLLFISFNLLSRGTTKQIQQLHTKISNDLLGIRKTYPKSQPIVYSLLDQVCKMYKISKNTLAKKKNLKKMVTAKDLEKNTLRVKNLSLKNKLLKIENNLNKSRQNFASTTKTLEQKDMLLAQLSKEKESLTSEKRKLEEEKKQLIIKVNSIQNQNLAQNNKPQNQALNTNISPKEEHYLNKIYHPSMKQRKNRLKDHQNLNLTSTSDPISPL